MSNPASDSFDNSPPAVAVETSPGKTKAPPGPRPDGARDPRWRAGKRHASAWPRRVWEAAVAACLPQFCALCGAPCGGPLLCVDCDRQLPRLPPACPRCALPSPEGAACASCVARPPPFDRAVAAYAYAFPLDRLLQQLKYAGRLSHAAHFAAALATRVHAWPDLLIPLPLAPGRQRARGYNQATEIARSLARHGGVELVEALVRTRDTTPQADLHGAERARNMRGAFAARSSLRGTHVAIVDDVMTTGATLRAAAIAARAVGACAVQVWAVARTLPAAPLP